MREGTCLSADRSQENMSAMLCNAMSALTSHDTTADLSTIWKLKRDYAKQKRSSTRTDRTRLQGFDVVARQPGKTDTDQYFDMDMWTGLRRFLKQHIGTGADIGNFRVSAENLRAAIAQTDSSLTLTLLAISIMDKRGCHQYSEVHTVVWKRCNSDCYAVVAMSQVKMNIHEWYVAQLCPSPENALIHAKSARLIACSEKGYDIVSSHMPPFEMQNLQEKPVTQTMHHVAQRVMESEVDICILTNELGCMEEYIVQLNARLKKTLGGLVKSERTRDYVTDQLEQTVYALQSAETLAKDSLAQTTGLEIVNQGLQGEIKELQRQHKKNIEDLKNAHNKADTRWAKAATDKAFAESKAEHEGLKEANSSLQRRVISLEEALKSQRMKYEETSLQLSDTLDRLNMAHRDATQQSQDLGDASRRYEEAAAALKENDIVRQAMAIHIRDLQLKEQDLTAKIDDCHGKGADSKPPTCDMAVETYLSCKHIGTSAETTQAMQTLQRGLESEMKESVRKCFDVLTDALADTVTPRADEPDSVRASLCKVLKEQQHTLVSVLSSRLDVLTSARAHKIPGDRRFFDIVNKRNARKPDGTLMHDYKDDFMDSATTRNTRDSAAVQDVQTASSNLADASNCATHTSTASTVEHGATLNDSSSTAACSGVSLDPPTLQWVITLLQAQVDG